MYLIPHTEDDGVHYIPQMKRVYNYTHHTEENVHYSSHREGHYMPHTKESDVH